MEKDTQPDVVSSVLKVFGIVDALSEQKEIGVTELAQRVMMSKSTIYRFLQTMKTLGIVAQEGETDKYRLTLKLFEISARALEYVDLIDLANKEMEAISKQTGETLHLGALDGSEIIYLHKIDSTYSLRMYSRVGRRNPSYSTAIGKVLLSALSDEEVENLLKEVEFVQHTENTLKNIDELKQELALIRQQHYAEDKEEQEVGLHCVAAPIYDRLGHIVAAISVSLPLVRFEKENLAHLVEMLHQAGRNVSKQLGYQHYPVAE
ncbi:DNA-binding transcriptional regulator KdgR [Avibacterium gallinarum]|uniref:DNA-binding transcriptional regulator KdgR n=1 Tax=Avibacterium gallinarum TaxID=755 RepID=UPI0039FCD5EC